MRNQAVRLWLHFPVLTNGAIDGGEETTQPEGESFRLSPPSVSLQRWSTVPFRTAGHRPG
jgi:hypothetical protein